MLTRRTVLASGAAASMLLATGLGTGTVSAAAFGGGPPTRPAAPTIVLVHGAFADATSWNAVVPLLQSRGYTVLAPANPLRGIVSDADYLKVFLSTITGPAVLVGHFYGGAVVTNAATGNPNIMAAGQRPLVGSALGTPSECPPG